MATKPSTHHHDGHRARMRERLLASGADKLADHELLELLLFYAIPRRDTNETAHQLIEECGSLTDVLEAPAERLMRVPGIKENVSVYIKALAELSRRYTTSKLMPKKNPLNTVYDSTEKVVDLLFPRFIGQGKEVVFAALFDTGMHVKDIFCVGEGSINSAAITVRAITERAYQRNASAVVIAHNHPGGVPVPSREDILMTDEVSSALNVVGIQLIDHFVFAESAYYAIIGFRSGERADRFAAMRAAQHQHFKRGNDK